MSSNNPTSIMDSLEVLESVSVSNNQVAIIGGTFDKMARMTKNPNIGELGGILSHRWGVQGTIEEEDEDDQDGEEDQEEEEYNQDLDAAAEYMDEVLETSDNYITDEDMRRISVESVNLTPPPPSSPESLSLEDQTRDYSTRVEGRMDSSRLSPVIITTPPRHLLRPQHLLLPKADSRPAALWKNTEEKSHRSQ